MSSRRQFGDFQARVISPSELEPDELNYWEQLCAPAGFLHSPFLSPHFVRAVASVRGDVYTLVVRRRCGELAGFLPFQFRTRLHKLLRVGEPAGELMNDHFGFIAAPDVRIPPDALLRLAGLTHIQFFNLHEGQAGYGLEGERKQAGMVLSLASSDTGSYWSDLRKRNKNFVLDTERQRRRIQEALGPLSFVLDSGNRAAEMENLIHYKRLQYVRTKGRDGLRIRWKRDLLEALAASRHPSCQGTLSTLYAGDTWVASHFGIRNQDVLSLYFPVYNPELSKYSPGRLLIRELIEAAPAAGLSSIDCAAGDNQYKREFGNSQYTVFAGAWYRHGLRSTAYRLSCSLRWRLLSLQQQ